MPLDPRWVQFANEDLCMARLAVEAEIWNQACFHAQQAAEKLLKSTFEAEDAPRTHKLIDLCQSASVSFPSEMKEALLLMDRFYIPTRYPDALPGSLATGLPNEKDASEALQTAESLRDFLTQE